MLTCEPYLQKESENRYFQNDPSLSDIWIKDNKDKIDKLISSVFEEVATANAEAASTSEVANGKRKHDEIEDDPPSSPEKPLTTHKTAPLPSIPFRPPPTQSKPPVKEVETTTDEELARQLAAQLNTPRTRSGDVEKRPVKKTKTKKKSAAQVGSDEDGDQVPKKKAKGGFQKEFMLSEPLATLMGVPKLSRPQVVKKMKSSATI